MTPRAKQRWKSTWSSNDVILEIIKVLSPLEANGKILQVIGGHHVVGQEICLCFANCCIDDHTYLEGQDAV